MHADPALDALFLPFDEGLLPAPAGGVFLGARDGMALRRWTPVGLTLEQDFRPEAEALERAGLPCVDVASQPGARYPAVLVLPPRQREQARALLARAVRLASGGGRVVAAAANNAGARSMQDDLEALAGPVSVLSKHKCRVAWSAPLAGAVDEALCEAWLALDAPRSIGDGALSRPGLFAWDRVDPASALLAAHLPADLAGRAADLGAGWGYLSRELLARCPRIRRLDAYEAQARALPVLQANLAAFASSVDVHVHWHDVTTGIDGEVDVVVSNPPFHAGDRVDRPELGRRFIEVAAAALRPGGRLFVVANRHLPYEATLAARFSRFRLLADAQGFKAYEATR